MLKSFRLDHLNSSLDEKVKRFEIDLKNAFTLLDRLETDNKAQHAKRLTDLQNKFAQEKRESLQDSLNLKKSTIMLVDAHALQLKTIRKSLISDILQPFENEIVAAQKRFVLEKDEINSILTTSLVRKNTLGRRKKQVKDEENEEEPEK